MRKRFSGKIVSDKMNKTRVVQIDIIRKHPSLYKVVKKQIRIMCHDEKNKTKIGDDVLIEATRPLSKKKHFRIVEVRR